MLIPLPSSADLVPFLPELTLIITMGVVLLVPVFSPKKNNLGVGIAAAAGIFAALFFLLRFDPALHAGPAFGGMLTVDPFGWFFKLIVLLFVLVVIALWALVTRESFGPGDGPEYFTLLIGATIGMMFMASASNLLMVFLAIETASLPSYVLAGFRKTHRLGAEAALKYVLFGAVSASVMLYGMSMLYGFYGTLDLAAIDEDGRQAFTIPVQGGHGTILSFHDPRAIYMLAFPFLTILLGVGFKIAMVPVHFWCPDVFEGTTIDITTFLSVASKGAGLVLLVRILTALIGPEGAAAANLTWLVVAVVILGGITCFWGNLAAFPQNNIKRLLAWSSIGHAGYMMLALATLMAPVKANMGPRGAEAILLYLFMYMFINAGAFVTAAAISQQIRSEDIRDYAGLGRRAPLLAVCMTVFVFALVGIPMTIGFSAKLKVFQVLFTAGHPIGYVAMAILGVNTVIAAFYYFRILRAMYLTTGEEGQVSEFTPAVALAALLVLPNVGLFLAYNWVDDQAKTFAHLSTADTTPVTHAATPEKNPTVPVNASVSLRR